MSVLVQASIEPLSYWFGWQTERASSRTLALERLDRAKNGTEMSEPLESCSGALSNSNSELIQK